MSNKLEDVHPEQTFRMHTGDEIRNLRQLLSVLTEISSESFAHHVNQEKNDFANWIRKSVGDKTLAGKLEQTIDFEESKQIINDHIIGLEGGIETSSSKEEIEPMKDPHIAEPVDNIEPISHHIHPFEHVKRGFGLILRDALIGFVIGLVLGYMWGMFSI